jgi:gamma-glutamyltranspeptidase/glutathione hydrolase
MKRTAAGKNGVVSSAHPLATRAGLTVLKKGGNAVDAAIATALTLGVVAPVWSGLGGGGFGLIHLSRSDKTVAVDYREVAPKNSSPRMFKLNAAGEVENDSNAIGPLAIAVPGAASGIATMLERYGSVELRDVCRFACDQAARKTPTSPTMRLIIRKNQTSALEKLSRFEPAGSVFLKTIRPLKVRSRFVIPKLADTLEMIAREGMQSFYHGSLAERIVTYLKNKGAILTQEDFAEYSPEIRDPVSGSYRGVEVRGMPPPSSGGITVIEILNIVEGFDFSTMRHNSPEAVHLIAEAMKLAYADRRSCIADPDFVNVPTSELSSKKHADRLRSMIDRNRVGLSYDASSAFSHDGGNTAHLNVMDKDGNVVALTESIECFFGSGIFVPEVGLLMNDEMHDFDPEPGRPNSIEAKKRPMSSMAPTILFKDGQPFLAVGSAGGPRIISSVMQTILNVVEFRMTLEQAVAAPRFHCQRDKITLEDGIGRSTLNALKKLGHRVEMKARRDLFFGGVQAAMFDSARKRYVGTADPRRDGTALAF